jgi:NAD(P)-dependent dehydrogenase (short-subunit alcohol dehydrogenase family)
MQPLQNKIAVVAGATRGAGRGIACALGEAGATVYCTGRSTRAKLAERHGESAPPFELAQRPETIEETAEMVTALGGVGIPVQVDHTNTAQVQKLFNRVKTEQGKLDILVEAGKKDQNFLASETPFYVGRAVAALAADADIMKKTGRVFSSWDLAVEYRFTDKDGRQPIWQKHFEQTYGKAYKICDEKFYEYWLDGPGDIVFPDWP